MSGSTSVAPEATAFTPPTQSERHGRRLIRHDQVRGRGSPAAAAPRAPRPSATPRPRSRPPHPASVVKGRRTTPRQTASTEYRSRSAVASRHMPRNARPAARPPQPLNHPVGRAHRDEEPVERSDREEVAVRLVLQLTEGALGVPHVQGSAEEVAGVRREVEFRVGDDASWLSGGRRPRRAAGTPPQGERARPRVRRALRAVAAHPAGSLLLHDDHGVPARHLT